MRRLLIPYLVLLFIAGSSARALAWNPPRDILGVRLGMNEDAVRARLKKIAKQQKEEREEEEGGEQEVWIFNKHPRFNYLLVRFDDQHRLIFITLVMNQPSRFRYDELGELKDAQAATDGRNYTYTWKMASANGRSGYAVVARGSDPQYLNSYSLYRLK